jgi:hypothetical protein
MNTNDLAAAEEQALDELAEWLAGNRDKRRCVAAEQHADGTFTLKLEHEHGVSGSYTQRTLDKAIRSALAIARAAATN